MDLTPLQRKTAFVAIVVALAGLGVFLLSHGSAPARGQANSGSHPAAAPRSAPPSQPPSTAPSPPATGPSQPVDIYQLLPFSKAGLAAAAGVVRRFTTEYATWSYNQSAAAYVHQMKGLITPSLSATLARGFATPGVAQQRAQQKQSATGTGQITALRAFGAASLTFVVTVTQQVTGSQGSHNQSTSYAVTATGTGRTWQVSDIELANQGNF
ncbi:MAG TPA: hypothetical protein VH641_08670 [Streptosporangiaceae bacterium]|jgi:hypothetical protein